MTKKIIYSSLLILGLSAMPALAETMPDMTAPDQAIFLGPPIRPGVSLLHFSVSPQGSFVNRPRTTIDNLANVSVRTSRRGGETLDRFYVSLSGSALMSGGTNPIWFFLFYPGQIPGPGHVPPPGTQASCPTNSSHCTVVFPVGWKLSQNQEIVFPLNTGSYNFTPGSSLTYSVNGSKPVTVTYSAVPNPNSSR